MRVRVRGRVQGVGFRWFIRERARKLGVTGWVRNCPDGAVEIAAFGDAGSLQLLREQIQTGPSGAHVEDLLDLPIDAAQAEAASGDFDILR